MNISITAQGKSICGSRLQNQDNMYINHVISNDFHEGHFQLTDDSILCFAVADGVGGASHGEKASQAALESIEQWQSECDPTDKDIEFEIRNAFNIANKRVIELSDELYTETGTTLTMLLFYKDKYYIANIGDSPAFLMRHKRMTPLHQRQGVKNILYAFVGNREMEGDEMVHITSGTYQKGDIFFLCSDGISNTLTSTKLYWLLFKKSITIDKILQKTEENNPSDNSTGLIVKIEG